MNSPDHDRRDRHYQTELAAYLTGDLDAAAAAAVRAHLESCPACTRELALIDAVWRTLESAPEEMPGEQLSRRFYATLDSIAPPERSGEAAAYGSSAVRESRTPAWTERFGWLIPRRPAIQFAMVLAVLAVGGLIGYNAHSNGAGNGEITQLREEVRSVSRLLIVSLLQQQSATERLQGVSWSYRVDNRDPEIVGALLQTLAEDPNVNVRLAALDALSRNLDQPAVRGGLVDALSRQTSPMIQLAIVEVVVASNLKESSAALKNLLGRPGVNETVKKRLQEAIDILDT